MRKKQEPSVAELRRRAQAEARLKPAPDPKTYLSMSEGKFRVIHQGVQLSRDLPTEAEAMRTADEYKLTVSPMMWNGDIGEWVPR